MVRVRALHTAQLPRPASVCSAGRWRFALFCISSVDSALQSHASLCSHQAETWSFPRTEMHNLRSVEGTGLCVAFICESLSHLIPFSSLSFPCAPAQRIQDQGFSEHLPPSLWCTRFSQCFSHLFLQQ